MVVGVGRGFIICTLKHSCFKLILVPGGGGGGGGGGQTKTDTEIERQRHRVRDRQTTTQTHTALYLREGGHSLVFQSVHSYRRQII